MSSPQKHNEGWVVTDQQSRLTEPPLYKVLLHNDDYTTMDFVVMVLEVVFRKDYTEATAIMMNVHRQGVGIAGIYTKDVAETKVAMVRGLALQGECPLKCSLEKA